MTNCNGTTSVPITVTIEVRLPQVDQLKNEIVKLRKHVAHLNATMAKTTPAAAEDTATEDDAAVAMLINDDGKDEHDEPLTNGEK